MAKNKKPASDYDKKVATRAISKKAKAANKKYEAAAKKAAARITSNVRGRMSDRDLDMIRDSIRKRK